MNKQSLAHYQEFKVNWAELSELPDDHLAVVAVLQFAVSETNALRKIYLCQDHDLTGEAALDSGINIHRFLILRTWSSRLFEVVQFLQAGQKKDFSSSKRLCDMAKFAMTQFDEICQGEGYQVARDIRNEAAHHYSFSAAKKNLKHVPKSMDCNMYLAKKSGNEFYPMGEAVMFHARLNRRWANLEKVDRDKKFLSWLEWNLNANSWLSSVLAMFVSELIFKGLGRNSVTKRSYWVSSTYAADRSGRLTPIFLQELS